MNKNESLDFELMEEFKVAFAFLSDHPAFVDNFPYKLWIYPARVCVNGYDLDGLEEKNIKIYSDNPKYKIIRRSARIEDIDNSSSSVEVEYKKYYGYEWKYDHIEFWMELGECRWDKNSKILIDWHNLDLDIKAHTYEEGVIKLAKIVKDKFGNFSTYGKNSIIPEWIEEYNKNKEPFFTRKIKGKGLYSMKTNPEYLCLTSSEINEIWWQTYYLKTPDARKKFNDYELENKNDQWLKIDHYLTKKDYLEWKKSNLQE